jgi:hypothetical protein
MKLWRAIKENLPSISTLEENPTHRVLYFGEEQVYLAFCTISIKEPLKTSHQNLGWWVHSKEDIAEILLKVTLNTPKKSNLIDKFERALGFHEFCMCVHLALC